MRRASLLAVSACLGLATGVAGGGGSGTTTRAFVLDRVTGQQLWSWQGAGEIESSPAVVDGVDYLGDSSGDV